MKSNTESLEDDLVQSIGGLAMVIQELARDAALQYSAEVEAILKVQSRDPRRIERCLDGMLDFCFDDGMLMLYKKLCRYYFDIDPEAAVSYVHAYREMWDEQKPGKRDELPATKKGRQRKPKGYDILEKQVWREERECEGAKGVIEWSTGQ